MDLGLKDKVIIVTGGSKGIGQGICEAIHAEGAIPVIVGRDEKTATELVAKFKENGGDAFNITKELGTPESCQSSIEEVVKKYGKIDGLVNNAGVNDSVGLENGSPEDFLSSMSKNLYHYYYLAHYAVPYLKETKGSIINISSKTATTGQGGTSGYAASKGAQLSLTREWAVELLKYEIRVNAIVPAEVYTPLYKKWLDTFPNPEETLAEITKNIPLGQRMTTIEEMGSMAAYLLSDKASHITGQHMYVDGGYVHLDRALAGNDR